MHFLVHIAFFYRSILNSFLLQEHIKISIQIYGIEILLLKQLKSFNIINMYDFVKL